MMLNKIVLSAIILMIIVAILKFLGKISGFFFMILILILIIAAVVGFFKGK